MKRMKIVNKSNNLTQNSVSLIMAIQILLEPSTNLKVLLIYLSFLTQLLVSECPHLCECKWKSGKESVICLNANLSSVPQQLDAGTQVLDLTGNNLVSVKHNEFARAGLLNLQKVHISKCRLRTLERYAFRSLINLVELDLSYNILTSIPSHTFDSIPELRELKLSGNPITRISNSAFVHLQQLVKLELSDCKINAIENEAFVGLEKSLEWLKLDNNKLQDIQPSSITILDNLHGLELANNPWNCSCNLRPLRLWMLRKNIPFGIPPVCSFPERISSKQWDKLNLDEFACAPEILAVHSKAFGVEGKNVTMTCRIEGVPEPTVRWILKNKVIANLSGTPYSNGKKLYIVHLTNGSSDLTILTADVQDAGLYICTAENKAGRAEASVVLAVSRETSHSGLSGKAFIVSVITGVLLVVLGCFIVTCFYSIRKKKTLKWRKGKCNGEENYEKIELNHKVPGSSSTIRVHQQQQQQQQQQEAFDRRHGDYRLIPGADNEQNEKDKDLNAHTIVTPVANGNNNEGQLGNSWSKNGTMITKDNKWESQELSLLEGEEVNHLKKENNHRDDRLKIYSSTYGTSNNAEHESSIASSNCLNSPFIIRKQYQIPYDNVTFRSSSSNIFTDEKFQQGYEEEEEEDDTELKKYQPDDLQSHHDKIDCRYLVSGRSNFEYSLPTTRTTTSDIYCTLPRKISDVYRRRKYSCPATDSQSPLLSESSRESGDGCGLTDESCPIRRFPDPYKNPIKATRRESFKSSSYMNLVNVNSENTNTPTLSYLERNGILYHEVTHTSTLYDHHAYQLKKFLEEYRTLQKELSKMKETCDNLSKDYDSQVYASNVLNNQGEDGVNESVC